jgi:hypothetical protein
VAGKRGVGHVTRFIYILLRASLSFLKHILLQSFSPTYFRVL